MVGSFYWFKGFPKVQIVTYPILMCPVKIVCAYFILDGFCHH